MNQRSFHTTSLLGIITLSITTLSMPCTRAEDGPPPKGWAGTPMREYKRGTDPEVMHDGRPSAFIESAKGNEAGFGTMSQFFSAADYLGKRVRFKGFLKTREVTGTGAGLWLRIDDAEKKPVRFDNMENRSLKGTTDWKEVSIVVDVPETSDAFAMGVLLVGQGRVWISGLSFEVVESSVPLTPGLPVLKQRHPENLDFAK